MKNIAVKLLHVTPESVVNNAVKKPYALEKNKPNLFYKVAKVYKHESIMEHLTFSFEILGISRLCLQELARHRIASLTVESTRFTLQKMLKNPYPLENYFVIPDSYNSLTYMYYLDALSVQIEALRNLDNIMILTNDELKYLLPESYRTNLTWTINARSLLNFFKLRLASNAHFEIRYLARLIYDKVSYLNIFEE